jgi:hypothetical protein
MTYFSDPADVYDECLQDLKEKAYKLLDQILDDDYKAGVEDFLKDLFNES